MGTGSDSKGKADRKSADRKTVRRTRKTERKRRASPAAPRRRRTESEPGSSPPRTPIDADSNRAATSTGQPAPDLPKRGTGPADRLDRPRYAWEPPADPHPPRDPPAPPGRVRPCATHNDQAVANPAAAGDPTEPDPDADLFDSHTRDAGRNPRDVPLTARNPTDPAAWLPDWDSGLIGDDDSERGMRRIPLRPPRTPGYPSP